MIVPGVCALAAQAGVVAMLSVTDQNKAMTTITTLGLPEEDRRSFWVRRHELLNWAHITYRYHRKRQWFFDVLEKLTQAAVVGAGVAVAGKTVVDLLPLLGGAIVFVGLLSLVFGYADKRQAHKELAQEAMQLVGDIQSAPFDALTESDLCAWQRTRACIDLKEPPNLKTLVAKCEWEQCVSEGHADCAPQVRWWQQAYMHFV